MLRSVPAARQRRCRSWWVTLSTAHPARPIHLPEHGEQPADHILVPNVVARIFRQRYLTDFSWASVQASCADPHRNSEACRIGWGHYDIYLFALRGVALEAPILKLMSVEDYQHICAVISVRSSALTRSPSLSRQKIRKLLNAFGAERSSKEA